VGFLSFASGLVGWGSGPIQAKEDRMKEGEVFAPEMK
jgi:hypothetical protein